MNGSTPRSRVDGLETILLKRVFSSVPEKVSSRNLFKILFVIFAVLYNFSRVGYFAPSGGDIAVWIFTHEWMSRGNTLYEGVWDHKDWGFFAITHPFYQFAGIKGLYVAALFSVYVFTFGVFLIVRRLTSFNKSVLVSFLASSIYTSSPSFLATYTENFSVSLSVLALGLIFRYPMISGVVFALSVAIKISGVLVFVVVIGLHLGTQYLVIKQSPSAIYRMLAKIVGGFSLASMMIVSITYIQGTLNGWIEVIDYNLEYGKIRRELMPPLFEVINFLKFASPGDPVILFLMCLGVVLIFLSFFLRIRSTKSNHEMTESLQALELIFPSIGIAVATLGVMFMQFPPSSQHWQYFVGGAVTLLSVLVSILWRNRVSLNLKFLLLIVVLLPVIVGTGSAFKSEGIEGFKAGIMRWVEPNEKGEKISLLQKVSPNSKVTFINSGSSLLDTKSLPDKIKLGCRFFYNFPHLLPRYGEQMLDCLESASDYVILRQKPLLNLEFQGKVLRILEDKYFECSIPENEFRVWASKVSLCSNMYPNTNVGKSRYRS